MPDGTPKFTGYTPASYTPSSIDWTQFATPLQQMQQSFDLAEQAIYETQFDFSALDADQRRAKEIEQEFAGFKESLSEDLLKTKDYRNAVRELRRANKIYNEDPEIQLYKRYKAERNEIEAQLNAAIEAGDMTETKKQDWLKYLDGMYAEQGGAGYNRETGSYNSSPFKMRNKDREKELQDFLLTLSDKATSWEQVTKTKGWSQLDADTQKALTQYSKTEFLQKGELSKDLLNVILQSDYFKDSLTDDLTAEYFNISRAGDSQNRGLGVAVEVIRDRIAQIDTSIEEAKKQLNDPKATEADKEYLNNTIAKLQKSKEEAENLLQTGTEEELRAAGKNFYISTGLYDKLLSMTNSTADLYEFLKTEGHILEDIKGLTEKGKTNKITIDDLSETNINTEKSLGKGTAMNVDSQGNTQVTPIQPGEMAIPFIEKNREGKDLHEYYASYNMVAEDFDNLELPAEGLDLSPAFLDAGINPEQITLEDETGEIKPISDYDQKRIKHSRATAQLYTALDKAYSMYDDDFAKLGSELSKLKDDLSKTTLEAERTRITEAIIEKNKIIRDLTLYRDNEFAGPNATLRKYATRMKKGGGSNEDYNEEFIEAVESGEYGDAWSILAKTNKENYLYLATSLTDPERATALQNAIQDPKKREQINRAGVTMLNEMGLEMIYNIKEQNGVVPFSGVIIDDKFNKLTDNESELMKTYTLNNIYNNDLVSQVSKIKGNEVSLKGPEELSDFNIDHYGSPVLWSSYTNEEGATIPIVKFNRKLSDNQVTKQAASSYAADKIAGKLGEEYSAASYTELSSELQEAYLKYFKEENPQELFVTVNNTDHITTIKNTAHYKFEDAITKFKNNIVNGATPKTSQFLGNILARQTNVDFATDIKLKNEYEEVGARLEKIAKKKGAYSMHYEHPSSPLFAVNPNDLSKGYYSYRLDYVWKDGGLVAQVYKDNYDSQGNFLADESFDYHNITNTKGSYAENVRVLDLYYGTGGMQDSLPKVGNKSIIPVKEIHNMGVDVTTSKPQF